MIGRTMPESWTSLTVSESVWNVPLTGKKIRQKQYIEKGAFAVIDQGLALVGGYTDDAEALASAGGAFENPFTPIQG